MRHENVSGFSDWLLTEVNTWKRDEFHKIWCDRIC